MTLLISQDAIDLIKSSEGIRLVAYPDPATHGVPWTIGYGHTSGVSPGLTITQKTADDFLTLDLENFQTQVLNKLTVKLNPNQLGALVSFAMNVKGWQNSSVIKYANNPKLWGSVPGRMALYRLAGSPPKIMPGLVTRRAQEGLLWLKPYAGSSDTQSPASEAPTVPSGGRPDFSLKGMSIAASGVAVSGLAGLSDDVKHLVGNVSDTVGLPGYAIIGTAILGFAGFMLYSHWRAGK